MSLYHHFGFRNNWVWRPPLEYYIFLRGAMPTEYSFPWKMSGVSSVPPSHLYNQDQCAFPSLTFNPTPWCIPLISPPLESTLTPFILCIDYSFRSVHSFAWNAPVLHTWFPSNKTTHCFLNSPRALASSDFCLSCRGWLALASFRWPCWSGACAGRPRRMTDMWSRAAQPPTDQPEKQNHQLPLCREELARAGLWEYMPIGCLCDSITISYVLSLQQELTYTPN